MAGDIWAEVKTEAEKVAVDAKAEIPKVEAEAGKVVSEVEADIPKIEAKVKAAAPWERYTLLGVLIFIILYLLWSFSHTRVQTPQVFTPTAPAVSAAKVDAPAPAKLRVVPKSAVQKKFPTAVIAPREQVIDTAKVPKAENGGTTITTIDQDTGEARTQFKADAAPWFAFEDNNTVAAGYGISTDGNQQVEVRYRRDLARVKDVHLTAEASGRFEVGVNPHNEGRAMIFGEFRF